ncbi:MAG: lipid A export permease/ATP-binding protein MsbA [Gammaproteobacteria bacterium]|nr:lipid A export permease/ATP-binding protein MsbA [Gammaproteobacteria bacterium]
MALDGKRIYLRLLHHAIPYWRVFLVAILSMIVLAITEPAIPALLKPTFDSSFVDKDLDTVALMAVLVVVLFLVRGLSSYLSALTLAWVASKVVMDLRTRMFDKLLSLPSNAYDQHTSGSLISKVTFNAAQVTEACTQVVTILVRDSIAVVGLLAWMLYLDWKLTLIALVIAPVIVAVVRYFSKRLRNVSASLQENMGGITHVLQESIEGQKVVRSFGGEEYEKRRFGDAANRVRQLEVKFASAASANAPVAQFVTAIGLSVMLYLAAIQVKDGTLTIGTFVSFFAAMGLVFSPLKRLTGVNGRLQKGIAAAQSIFALIDEESEPDSGTREIRRARGRIEFDNVDFRYGDKRQPALKNVSLAIEPGESVALVGASGSGKTTLVNLILRFYRPDSGRILLDDTPIDDLTLKSLRSQTALVSQDIVLFNGTVAENIAYGPLADRSRDEIIEAARFASALSFIEALPDGLDTEVGENGVRLSGGQRQRLAIARAFLKDAPVLILDEATSSLDSAVEKEVQRALAELRRNRTTIIIAHRLSTIEDVDRIVVMNEGRVIETGTHETLLEKNSLYAGLYRFQFAPQSRRQTAANTG